MTVSLSVLNSFGTAPNATDIAKEIKFVDINKYSVTNQFETSLGGKVLLAKSGLKTLVNLYNDDDVQMGNFTFGDVSEDVEIDPSITTYPEVADSDQEVGLDSVNWGMISSWDSEDANDLTMTYPEEKVIADVYVAPMGAVVSGAGIVPVVKDSELGSYKTSKNLVVVGGPAINTIAAELMGLSFPTYGDAAGFKLNEAMITLYEGKLTPGKVALLVAGYDAKDTAAAAKALIAEKKFGTLKTASAEAYEYA
jgi:hypothetical protein